MPENPSIKHPELAVMEEFITKVRDVLFGGEPAIRAKIEDYLPMQPGGDQLDTLGNSRYSIYTTNALFYALASRVFDGLQGACFRKDPEVFVNKSQVDSLRTIYKGSESFFNLCKKTLAETLAVSRFGLLVDWLPGAVEPSILSYKTENIVNWRYGVVNGSYQLILVVLKEVARQPSADNRFEENDVVRYRVLELISSPDKNDNSFIYKSSVYDERTEKNSTSKVYVLDKGSVRLPQKKGGNYWNYIPFELTSAIPDSNVLPPPLMWPVVAANLSHFKSSAAYENLVNITGFPILWGAGIPDNQAKEIYVGSPKAHLFESEKARLEFATAPDGADVVKANMENKKELIVLLGGRLLQREREAVESAQTHKEKKIGENSVLATVVRSVSASLTKILIYWHEAQKLSVGKVGVGLNADFSADNLNSNTLEELTNMYEKKAISFHTYWYNLHKLEVYPDNWKKGDEINALKTEEYFIKNETEQEKSVEVTTGESEETE